MNHITAKTAVFSILLVLLFSGCKDLWHPEGSELGDGPPPNPPSSVTASAASSSSITVSWSSVSGAAFYKVWRSSSASGTYSQVGTSSTTSYTDTGLSANTTYYYIVSAVNSNGEGFSSSYASATTTTSNTVTVTYNVNGGSGTTPSSQTVSSGSSVTLASGSGLTRSGYTFAGWNTNSSGTGTNYSAGSSYTPTGNITWYAKWDIASSNGTEVYPIPLTASTWENGSINSSNLSGVWYSFDVTSGTTYRIWWNDSYEGSGSKTLDVKVSAVYSNGTTIFTRADSGWVSPRSFTASTNGTVKVKVEPYSSGTATFAIAYNTSSIRP